MSKADIARVGTFLPSGQPSGWSFSGTGRVVGMELRRGQPTLYGGYTLEELRDIAGRYAEGESVVAHRADAERAEGGA